MRLNEVAKTAADKLQAEKAKIQKILERYGLWPFHVDQETGEVLKNPNYKPHKNFSEIESIVINDDLTVSVNGSANFENSTFKRIPVKFKKLGGAFLTSNSNLETLEGLPDEMTWVLQCGKCVGLTTLVGGPKKVVNILNFVHCTGLKNLDGIPELVRHSSNSGVVELILYGCINLTSLEGLQDHLPGTLDISWCKNLKSLKGIPTQIGGGLSMEHLNIDSFDFLPKRINGTLDVTGCKRVKNYLALMDIKGVDEIKVTDKPQLEKILNNHLGDMLNCQDELIEAGFEEYAEVE